MITIESPMTTSVGRPSATVPAAPNTARRRPDAAAIPPAGPRAALYSAEFFQLEAGDVTAYVPVAVEVQSSDRVRMLDIPPQNSRSRFTTVRSVDLDQTYGALGTYVAERESGGAGPIREHYLVTEFDADDESGYLTEVCWPVFHTAATS
jgi:effector-binding domain-containing protein